MHTDKEQKPQEPISLEFPIQHFFKKGHPFAPICLMPVIYGEGISAQNTCQGRAAQNKFWNDIENNNKIIEALKKNSIKIPRRYPAIISKLANIDPSEREEKLAAIYETTGNSFRMSLSPNKEDTISRFHVKRNTPGCFTVTRKNRYGSSSDSGLGNYLRIILENTDLEALKKICEYKLIINVFYNQ